LPYKNKEDRKKYERSRYKYPSVRFKHYKKDARKRGFVFKITSNEFSKLITEPCYYCGGDGYGIDRLDNTLGYVKNNIVPCCSMCNYMKRIYTEEDFVRQCIKIANFKLYKK